MAEKLELKKEQADRIFDYAETFGTDAGKRVLNDLELSYGGECHVRGDLYETLDRSSKRDLLSRIKEMIQLANMEIIIEEEGSEEE